MIANGLRSLAKKSAGLKKHRSRDTLPVGADSQLHANFQASKEEPKLPDLSAEEFAAYIARRQNAGNAPPKSTPDTANDSEKSDDDDPLSSRQFWHWWVLLVLTILLYISTLVAIVLVVVNHRSEAGVWFLVWLLLSIGFTFAASAALWVMWDRRRMMRLIEQRWIELEAQKWQRTACEKEKEMLASKSAQAREKLRTNAGSSSQVAESKSGHRVGSSNSDFRHQKMPSQATYFENWPEGFVDVDFKNQSRKGPPSYTWNPSRSPDLSATLLNSPLQTMLEKDAIFSPSSSAVAPSGGFQFPDRFSKDSENLTIPTPKDTVVSAKHSSSHGSSVSQVRSPTPADSKADVKGKGKASIPPLNIRPQSPPLDDDVQGSLAARITDVQPDSAGLGTPMRISRGEFFDSPRASIIENDILHALRGRQDNFASPSIDQTISRDLASHSTPDLKLDPIFELPAEVARSFTPSVPARASTSSYPDRRSSLRNLRNSIPVLDPEYRRSLDAKINTSVLPSPIPEKEEDVSKSHSAVADTHDTLGAADERDMTDVHNHVQRASTAPRSEFIDSEIELAQEAADEFRLLGDLNFGLHRKPYATQSRISAVPSSVMLPPYNPYHPTLPRSPGGSDDSDDSGIAEANDSIDYDARLEHEFASPERTLSPVSHGRMTPDIRRRLSPQPHPHLADDTDMSQTMSADRLVPESNKAEYLQHVRSERRRKGITTWLFGIEDAESDFGVDPQVEELESAPVAGKGIGRAQ